MLDNEYMRRMEQSLKERVEVSVDESVLQASVSQSVEDLRNGGTISQSLPGYSERQSQIEMARIVELALQTSKDAVIEAPTGVGKSLAYLIPIVRTGRKVIVSTSNKALQDQIFRKDIPFVREHIEDFVAVRLKGFNNYVCLALLDEASKQLSLPNMSMFDEIKLVQKLMDDESFSGEFEDMGSMLSPEVVNMVKGDTDTCTRDKCQFYEQCPIMRERRRATEADIVVMNHLLLMYIGMAERGLLSTCDAIVVDEAHELEKWVVDAYSYDVSSTQIGRILKRDRIVKNTTNDTQYAIRNKIDELWRILSMLFIGASRMKDTIIIVNRVEEGVSLAELLMKLREEMRNGKPLTLDKREDALYDKDVEYIGKIASHMRKAFSDEHDDNYAYYLERDRITREVKVVVAPIDVAPIIKKQLLDECNVIFTSATLAMASGRSRDDIVLNDLSFFSKSVGLEGPVIGKVLPQVFNYRENSMLYYPEPTFPETKYNDGGVRDPNYIHVVSERMLQLTQLSRGRAFLLFTSKEMLEAVYNSISVRLSEYQVLKQGEYTNTEIIRMFKEGNSVLFGLKTFWEGVDIQGSALSLVVIDKLPFDTFDDPLNAARKEKIENAGGNFFSELSLPRMILRLKQGMGRLIRTETDRGVMAILDVRISTKPYGKRVLSSLPNSRKTTSLRDVERFFNS